jgi:hypothetical protein
MLNNKQMLDMEEALWVSTTSPEAYRCLQELKRTREAMQSLINEVYAVLAENHDLLRETPKLERLESIITIYEEFLQ